MNRDKQAPSDFFVGVDWGNAFRAQAVGAIPAMPRHLYGKRTASDWQYVRSVGSL